MFNLSISLSPRNSKKTNKGFFFKEMTPTSGRIRVGGSFRIQGQGYQKQDAEQTIEGAAASGSVMASADWDKDDNEIDDDVINPQLVDELVGINRTLEKQIETLRLRLDFDTRHHESQKTSILAETGAQLKSKADEINRLKETLNAKDTTIQTLGDANQKRDSEITELRRQIEELNNDVDSAKFYANDLVSELGRLAKEKEMYESQGMNAGGQDQEISALRKEVSDLKLNLATLEGELTKARDVMSTQTGKIKFMESDKKSIQLKFKEELAKVSHSMRLEVEKMRDVMIKQWSEMRSLREQNLSMSRDIKDIRSLLVNGCLDDEAKLQQQQQQQHTHEGHGHAVLQAPPAVPVPQTARGGKTVYNNFNLGALKPSLPVLNKDAKKNVQRRK